MSNNPKRHVEVIIRELWATERSSMRLYNCLQANVHKRVMIRGIARECPPGSWLVTPSTGAGDVDAQRIITNVYFENNFIKHDRGPNQ